MKAYIDIGRRILDEGVWLSNVRTGQKTLAIIGTTFEYDLSAGRESTTNHTVTKPHIIFTFSMWVI
jgi:thymidylate synthase